MATGKRAATIAAKILRAPKSAKKKKPVAPSDLAQRDKEQTKDKRIGTCPFEMSNRAGY